MTDLLLRKGISLARAGRRQEARDLFIQLVTEDEENELAWLWLVDLVDNREDQIIALENALSINPANEKARLHLRRLEAGPEQRQPAPGTPATRRAPASADDLDEALVSANRDLAAVARRYEAAGELEKATIAYEQILAREEKGSRRSTARKRLAAVRRQLELQQPVPIHTTFTLLRLSLGPFLLYLLLILIQGAYRPWRVSPLFYLGSIVVLAGSLLLVGSRTTPQHPGWRRLLGEEGLRSDGERLLWGAVGLMLVALPYLSFLAAAFRRLQTTPGAPLPGG